MSEKKEDSPCLLRAAEIARKAGPEPPRWSKEALNKPILDFSEHAKQKAWFLLCFIFNGLPPSKMAAHPYAAGTSELIRGSL
ncbi:MAG: hypothetical protein ACT4NU_00655, partial [Chromatiales bacterium]